MEIIVHNIRKEFGIWVTIWNMDMNYNMTLLMPQWTSLRDSTTRRDSYVLAFLRFGFVKKKVYVLFLPFGFINVIIFVINLCDPYSRFVGADSCVKVCFGAFGLIRTNLWLITYQFTKVIVTIFIVWLSVVNIFSKKRDSFVLFQSLKWLWLNQKKFEHPLIS